jgi:hypothetical protein
LEQSIDLFAWMHWIFPSVYRLPEHDYSLTSFANGTGGIVLIGRIMRKNSAGATSGEVHHP